MNTKVLNPLCLMLYVVKLMLFMPLLVASAAHVLQSFYIAHDVQSTLQILVSLPALLNSLTATRSTHFNEQLRQEQVDRETHWPWLDSLHIKCISIFSCILENVVSLRVQCESYSRIGLVVGVIKSAIASGQARSLKHLVCTTPDLYMDIIDPLCSLFLLQNFHLLTLDLNHAYTLTLSKLLQAFYTAPCVHMSTSSFSLLSNITILK